MNTITWLALLVLALWGLAALAQLAYYALVIYHATRMWWKDHHGVFARAGIDPEHKTWLSYVNDILT